MSKRRQILGTLAALLGVSGATPTPPAQLPPAAIVHEMRPRPRRVRPMREVPKTPSAVAHERRAADKRAAKRARRAALRRGEIISWRTAHARATYWQFIMSGGTHAMWRNVHDQIARAV